ncbi:hypothetical protein CRV01_09500 [Arcobacter sp. CECT 8983]|uniref:hypothetical protein n=1 Tax=Arcobacter sp. CECT 8983 TaxID=2044508 RepID=UPI00100BFB1A|nr:hypothetical protein [Arcobacter sp. CECT 8983]RXJ88848.1 hypothetical protein CRV01_09500 [Arcobacter sp. CECT 8983]
MSDFLNLIKESNYNLLEIYKQAPNETLIVVAVLLALIALAYFFINHTIKKSIVLKELAKVDEINTFDELNAKLVLFVNEVPKRGEVVAKALDENKDKILFRSLKILSGFSIKDKIKKYQTISKRFKQLSDSTSKYNNNKLTSFFKNKSLLLINNHLAKDIDDYASTIHFCEAEVENVNAIVQYANKQNSPWQILDVLFKNLNSFSFSYNLELYKFTEKLDKKNSKQVYDYCTEKIKNIFTSGKNEVSVNILEYLYEKDEKEKVYEYIKTLTKVSYLQYLYKVLFDNKDDLHLDLAFIANPTKIKNEYKEYIDNSLTTNWRDKEHIEFVSKSPGVLEVLGHTEFRSLIERVDRIKTDIENNKKIEEALTIAKRAESIAIEAKSFNQAGSKKKKEKPVFQPKVD